MAVPKRLTRVNGSSSDGGMDGAMAARVSAVFRAAKRRGVIRMGLAALRGLFRGGRVGGSLG